MGGINWSVLHQPAPPSAMQQGTSMLSDALDAILQRRQQQQLKQAEIAAASERARLKAEAEFEQNAVKNHYEQLKIDNDVATQKANQANMEGQRAHDQAKLASDAYERAAPELAAGNISAVAPGLRAAGIGVRGPDQRRASGVPVAPPAPPQAPPMPVDPADAAFAPPGVFDGAQSLQPPPVGANPQEEETNKFLDGLAETVDPTAPAGAYAFEMPGQSTPTYFDPAQVEAERRAEGTKVRGSFAQTAKEPYELEALSNTEAAIASGTIKRTEAARYYTDQVKAARDRMERANRPRGHGGGGDRYKDADDKRADVTAFEGALQRWENQNKVGDATEARDKFNSMRSGIDDYRARGDTIAARKALYMTARYITGPGVLTKQEFDNTVTNTSGLTASLITKLKTVEDGEISDAEARALERFVANTQVAMKRQAAKTVTNFDEKFDPRGYHGGKVPTEVALTRSALMNRFDLTDDDIASVRPKKKLDAKAVASSADRARAKLGAAKVTP